MLVSTMMKSSEDRRPPEKSQSLQNLTALQLARHEYHPIGGCSKLNNNSAQTAKTMGTGSWQTSGGLKSEYNSQVGNPTLPAFGSPPQFSPSVDMSASYLPKEIRAEGKRRARADQAEGMRQHGEGSILLLARGDMQPANPAEELIFRGGGVRTPGQRTPVPQSGGQGRALSTGCSRRSDESWGSAQSNPASELRRIHELAENARALGMKHASANQLEAVQQHGQGTIIGLAKGMIQPANPVEEQLLAPRRATAESNAARSRLTSSRSEFGLQRR